MSGDDAPNANEDNDMNKHTAILPNGTVATRNSKTRVYTHCVAGLRTAEQKLAQARENLKHARKHLRDYEATLARIVAGEQVSKYLGADDYRHFIEDEKRDIAELEQRQLSDYADEWVELGWCGRRDLALKKAQSESDLYAQTIIIEARVA